MSRIIVLVLLAAGFMLAANISSAYADEPPPNPCLKVLFSSSEAPDQGCGIAAFLHFGGVSLDQVRGHVGRLLKGRGAEKRLASFNKRLRSLAKAWLRLEFMAAMSIKDIAAMTDEQLLEKLTEAPQRMELLHLMVRTDGRIAALERRLKALEAAAGKAACPPPSATPAPPPPPPQK